jgi:hypothetical protein
MRKIIFLLLLNSSSAFAYDYYNTYDIPVPDVGASIQCPNQYAPTWALQGNEKWCLLENGTYSWKCNYESYTDCRNAKAESNGQGLKCCPNPKEQN